MSQLSQYDIHQPSDMKNSPQKFGEFSINLYSRSKEKTKISVFILFFAHLFVSLQLVTKNDVRFFARIEALEAQFAARQNEFKEKYLGE